MKAASPGLEFYVSKSAQSLQLYHKSSVYKPIYHNNTTDSIGIIFVNKGSQQRPELVYHPWHRDFVDETTV